MKRLLYVSAFAMTTFNFVEKLNSKPFNPLQFETFELVTDRFEFLGEQITHHPIVYAFMCRGKAGYKVWSNALFKINLHFGHASAGLKLPTYVELEGVGENGETEVYQIMQPMMSVHNLIVGKFYIDIAGRQTIRNLSREGEVC